MAERHATSEQDFEDFVRRSRNPSGSCVGASTCACGAEKGQARWARYAQGSPKGTKCWECGSTSKWRREKGYTNRGRVALETKKQRFAKVKGLLKSLKAAMASTEPERLNDIDAIVAEVEGLEQLPAWGAETSDATNTEKFEELGHAQDMD